MSLCISTVWWGNFDLAKMRYRSWYNPGGNKLKCTPFPTPHRRSVFLLQYLVPLGEKRADTREISRKFDPERLQQQLGFFNLQPVRHFTDPNDWFSLLLFKKAAD